METKHFKWVTQIIERESKTASYKFALIRATIDISQQHEHHVENLGDGRVGFPTGLLIERWLMFYYPILAHERSRLKQTSNPKMAFENEFLEIIGFYRSRGGFPVFFNDIRTGDYPESIHDAIHELVKKVHDTIRKQPMKYIGSSLWRSHYALYNEIHPRDRMSRNVSLDLETLISSFGKFSIPRWFYETLRVMGGFLAGQESLLVRWAEFTAGLNQEVDKYEALTCLIESPEVERNVSEIKKLLGKQENLHCIWSDKPIPNGKLDIDHCIPFSAFWNNDLWNLLPTHTAINLKKSNKIPDPDFLEKRKRPILEYWEELEEDQELHSRFLEEMNISLLGSSASKWNGHYLDQALVNLQNKCDFLIRERGMEPFFI